MDLLAGLGQLTASKETLESQAQKSQELGQLQGSQEQEQPLSSLGRGRCQRHPLLLLLTSGSREGSVVSLAWTMYSPQPGVTNRPNSMDSRLDVQTATPASGPVTSVWGSGPARGAFHFSTKTGASLRARSLPPFPPVSSQNLVQPCIISVIYSKPLLFL